MKVLRKRWWLLLVTLGVMLVAPLSASAITAPDALAGLKETFSAILEAFKMYLEAIP